jgi:hypothetical protein
MHVKKKSVAKKDTANFQCFISQKQKELQEKKIVFNFFTSPPTTDFFLTCISRTPCINVILLSALHLSNFGDSLRFSLVFFGCYEASDVTVFVIAISPVSTHFFFKYCQQEITWKDPRRR